MALQEAHRDPRQHRGGHQVADERDHDGKPLALIGPAHEVELVPGDPGSYRDHPEQRRLEQHQPRLDHRQGPGRGGMARQLERQGEGGGEVPVVCQLAPGERVLRGVIVEHRRAPAQAPGHGMRAEQPAAREAQTHGHREPGEKRPCRAHRPHTSGSGGGATSCGAARASGVPGPNRRRPAVSSDRRLRRSTDLSHPPKRPVRLARRPPGRQTHERVCQTRSLAIRRGIGQAAGQRPDAANLLRRNDGMALGDFRRLRTSARVADVRRARSDPPSTTVYTSAESHRRRCHGSHSPSRSPFPWAATVTRTARWTAPFHSPTSPFRRPWSRATAMSAILSLHQNRPPGESSRRCTAEVGLDQSSLGPVQENARRAASAHAHAVNA